MKIHSVFLLLLCALTVRADEPVALRAALERVDLRGDFAASGRDQITLTLANSSKAAVSVAIPAGAICGAGALRLIVLQGATLTVAPGKTAEALLPAAALSAKVPAGKSALHLLPDTEPRLDPLLKHLANNADFPRATAQLVALCLLEDVTFAQWQRFLADDRPATTPPGTHPTPAEVASAIDVLGVLREIAPERTFALAGDGELKLRALRNPWCRAKAMQLFGMSLTGDAAEAEVPNLRQLLHLKPGDNCPVCRERATRQNRGSEF